MMIGKLEGSMSAETNIPITYKKLSYHLHRDKTLTQDSTSTISFLDKENVVNGDTRELSQGITQKLKWITELRTSQISAQEKLMLFEKELISTIEENEQLKSHILKLEFEYSKLNETQHHTELPKEDTLREFVQSLYNEYKEKYHSPQPLPVNEQLQNDYNELYEKYMKLLKDKPCAIGIDMERLVEDGDSKVAYLAKYCSELMNINKVLDLENKLAICQIIKMRVKVNKELAVNTSTIENGTKYSPIMAINRHRVRKSQCTDYH